MKKSLSLKRHQAEIKTKLNELRWEQEFADGRELQFLEIYEIQLELLLLALKKVSKK